MSCNHNSSTKPLETEPTFPSNDKHDYLSDTDARAVLEAYYRDLFAPAARGVPVLGEPWDHPGDQETVTDKIALKK